MPLDPLPPSSPRGKVVSTKHCCLSTEPCPIRLSDVGRRFHSFPKGTFRARFSPPIVPRVVLCYLASHPPVWTWTTKDGPNKGKSFQVPMVPIICEKTAPRAICWLVTVFHLFKTHLHPVALDTDTGKVRQGWLCLYQNNLRVHLQSQLKASSPPPPPAKPLPPTPRPPGKTPAESHPTTANSQIAALQAEIVALCESFYKYIASHETCCHRSNSPSVASSEDDPDQEPPPSPPPPQFSLQRVNPDGSPPAVTNHPTWLVTALSTPDLPSRFTGDLTYTGPLTLAPFPENIIEVVKLKYGGTSPFYLGVSQLRHLAVAATSDRGLVTKSLTLPPDPSVPKARH
ncbi:hypothetical protein EDC04DRAFT_2611516 [Pisolithus marmoratus]|nr:hypothetical protein EDC04DRAFT_2611516 [Pisolithus marmoratus]